MDNLKVSASKEAKGGGSTVARNLLYLPAEVKPTALSITAAPITVNLGGGNNAQVWAYNQSFPGPTIRANRGDNATITFQNQLPEHSIIHWHGLVVSTENDGQPQQAIQTGETYDYNFSINQRAAFNWYHPHPHMMTGEQVYNGLAGGFIVNDSEESAKNLPSGKYEVPLVIRDATFSKSGDMLYKPTSGGFFGQIALVNGTKDPYLDVDRAVYRFRILNGANSRVFGLALSNGASMHLIGNDGGLLPLSSDQARIDMGNGERTDVLIDFRNYPAGSKIMLRDLRAGWDILEFRVGNTEQKPFYATLPLTSAVEPLPAAVKTRTFSFDGMTKINGNLYDVNRIDWTVKKGDTELWVFKTNGNAPHPVHIHGASFQVVSRSGGRGKLFAWEAGWKDTVLLEDRETVTVRIRFDSFTGRYVMHCHKLEHEDMGMMANFEVVQ
ncbi:multicopper oxidase family protein [Pontibacter saemangeumensis]|uniref:Multicopper oxidase family protein n=1 Tax=Pontibacter saemangeumensis TaxID=1084525 RepID=A0ABP8LXW4_9BACT